MKNMKSASTVITCAGPSQLICLHRDYVPELARARAQHQETLQQKKDESMNRLMKDLAVDRERNPDALVHDQWDAEDEEEEEDGGDADIIDRSPYTLPPPDNFC